MIIGFLLLALLLPGIFFASLIFLWRTRSSQSSGKGRKKIRLLALGAAIASTVMLGWFVWVNLTFYLWARECKKATDKRERMLLYHTDHHSIRDAARTILADTNTYPTDSPPVEQLPQAIRDLAPSYVLIDNDRLNVSIEMGGGFFHYGVQIWKEGAGGSGTKELIPGMWFYAEDEKIVEEK